MVTFKAAVDYISTHSSLIPEVAERLFICTMQYPLWPDCNVISSANVIIALSESGLQPEEIEAILSREGGYQEWKKEIYYP